VKEGFSVTMQYIRDTYGVPAKRGGKVEYTGQDKPVMGTICGARAGYLRIRLDGAKHSRSYHPLWKLTYLPGIDRHGCFEFKEFTAKSMDSEPKPAPQTPPDLRSNAAQNAD
jgi:hypothetical protein